MNLKNTKIKMLDLDLKGCVYLNHLSQTQAVALFFMFHTKFSSVSFSVNAHIIRLAVHFFSDILPNTRKFRHCIASLYRLIIIEA